jgi:general secretion pathway protein E
VKAATDNLDDVAAMPHEAAVELSSESVRGLLPFGFSKAHQVVLERGDDGLVLSHVGRLQTDTLLEVRRVAGEKFLLEKVDEAYVSATFEWSLPAKPKPGGASG